MSDPIFDLDLEILPVGARVKTKTGFIWRRLGPDSWTDERTGLHWLSAEPKTYTHGQATELQTDKKRLPTKKDFEYAEKHGIREIFNMHGKWFWSASVHPNYSYFACVFYGSYGVIVSFYRDYVSGSVRCVGR